MVGVSNDSSDSLMFSQMSLLRWSISLFPSLGNSSGECPRLLRFSKPER